MIVLQADQVLHIRADSLLFCASGFYSRSSVEERGEGTWRLDRIGGEKHMSELRKKFFKKIARGES